jgi:hypothetical protein
MGRKSGSTTLHPDWALHLWLAIQVLCETKLSKTGRRITPHAAAKLLAETGGEFGIVGGDHASIAATNPRRITRLIEMCAVKEDGEIRLKEESRIAYKNDILSRVFVSHRLENFRSLLQRYYEIAKKLQMDPATEFAWNNILNDRLGRPRKPSPWTPRNGRLHFRMVQNSIVLASN